MELVENFKESNCLQSITQPMVKVFVIYLVRTLTIPFKHPKTQCPVISYQCLAEPRREEKLSVNIPGLQDQGEVDDDAGACDGVYGGGGEGGRSDVFYGRKDP